ncbi:MAG: BamA/TamA family outer membrane protein [Myxococcales bacterium]|nr:BamA/TamA family outer membrane protein [Myxococcales bacterium]
MPLLPLAALLVGLTQTSTAGPGPIEWAVLPGVALDSALGVGLATVFNIARLDPHHPPYAWRLSALTQVYLGRPPGRGVQPTLQLYRFTLDVPRFLQDDLRLTSTLDVSRLINAGFYGLGNASTAEAPWEAIDEDGDPEGFAAARRYHEYDRIYVLARAVARQAIGQDLLLFYGGDASYNWVNVFPGSRLAEALATPGNPRLVGVGRHARLEGTVGLALDTRDDEIAPTWGRLWEGSLRAGQLLGMEGTYGGVNVTLRQYLAPLTPRLVLASRLMVDVLFGDAPLYELARHGGLFPGDGPAGPMAVRGPRVQRYHGKVKVFGNLELRSRIFTFDLFGKTTTVGLVAFVDAGRVFADLVRRPALDGTGVALHWAAGGGFRYRLGRTFLIRGDLGWSPDGILFSVDANHAF